MKIAVVGATGLVGGIMLKVIEEQNIPVDELWAVASERSVGKKLQFKNQELTVIGLEEAVKLKPDIAIFSAGGTMSKKWAPRFAEVGCTVIDNSSAWRMHENIPLVVPEINASQLKVEDKIIANPNCSTIQLVMALAPLHKAFQIKRMVLSTYQSVSGSGQAAVQQMHRERAQEKGEMVYPHPIDLNVLPHGGDFLDNGYTTEEMKLVHESRKILSAPELKVTSTVVRVPVLGGHSISANIEFENEYQMEELISLLDNMPGIEIQDKPENNEYPMPLYAHQKDSVFVGRIRRDESQKNSVNLWIVADNLRKGAATNAVQIAKYLIENKLV
jgi:aspartate-semialdehyde dehydrogenase